MARVLVVDDVDVSRLRLRKLLEQRGHVVVEAKTGSEAVDVYRQSWPEAVLFDISLTGSEGLSVFAALRQLDPGARIAIVTGAASRSNVFRAIQAGARDFVAKPYEPERLFKAVQKLLDVPPSRLAV